MGAQDSFTSVWRPRATKPIGLGGVGRDDRGRDVADER
jgi:hypothetical protein